MTTQPVSTQVLSVICPLTGRELNLEALLKALHLELSRLNVLVDLVLILRGHVSELVNTLRSVKSEWDSMQLYVMDGDADLSAATMVGMENSIGDWIVTIDIDADDPSIVRRLLESALRDSAEVVLSVPEIDDRPFLDALLSRTFHRFFRLLHGFSLRIETPSARLFSRVFVNRLLRDEFPLIAFETLTAQPGCRKRFVPCTRRRSSNRNIKERAQIRWRTLIGFDAMPLRIANLCLLLIAAAVLAYSTHETVTHLLQDDAVPGWTVLALLLSATLLMLAVVMWLLSEYMLILFDPGARRPRYEMASEFDISIELPANSLNVEAQI